MQLYVMWDDYGLLSCHFNDQKGKGWVDLGQKYIMYEKVNHVRSRHYTSHAL